MGFIKNAMIGIALYEAVKYFLRKEGRSLDFASEGMQAGSPSHQQLRSDEVDIIAGARQTDHLKRMKENASSGLASEPQPNDQDSGDDLASWTDPESPLTGEDPNKASDDPWKKSLANDELRAPDS